MGFKPTRNPVEYAGVIVLRFADGKIVEHRAVADTAGSMSAVSDRGGAQGAATPSAP